MEDEVLLFQELFTVADESKTAHIEKLKTCLRLQIADGHYELQSDLDTLEGNVPFKERGRLPEERPGKPIEPEMPMGGQSKRGSASEPKGGPLSLESPVPQKITVDVRQPKSLMERF